MPTRNALLLLTAIGVVFWPVLGGDFVYDDAALIVRNPAVQNGDLGALLTQPLFGQQHGYWRPLTSLLLWLGNQLGGAPGIHALALLLHGSATLVLFDLGKRLLGAEQPAFWAALLFAIHPVQVESVAWCAAINDPLWGLCALLAMRAALRWRDRPCRGLPWASGIWCLLGLLAKENAITALPLVLAVVAWAPHQDAAPARASLRPVLLVLSGVLVVWWLLRALVFGEGTAGLLRAVETPPLDPLRLLSAPPELLLRHLLLLIAPFPLTPLRGFADHAHALQAVLGIAVVAGLLLGVALAWRKLSGPTRIGLLLLLAPLLPTLLRFRSIGAHPVADRYLYLAVSGAALLLVRLANGRAGWLLGLIAAVGGALSFAQTWVWHDQAHFVEHVLHHHPDDPLPSVMAGELALAAAQAGDRAALDEARSHYERAAQQAPRPTGANTIVRARADAELGLAWCLMLEQGMARGPGTPAMLAAFRAAVEADPESAAAWVGLGVANGIAEQPAAAEAALRKATALDPDRGEAWFNLAYLQAGTGHREQARASLLQALRCNPENKAAQQMLDQLR